MKFQKQIIYVFTTLFLLNLVHAQNKKEEPEDLILTPGPIISNYSKNDLKETYDKSSITIKCNGSTCKSSCKRRVLYRKGKSSRAGSCKNNVSLKKGKVTISKAGTYILEGNLNGQLYINAGKNDLVHLILRNANISSNFGPAIYSEKCRKVVITTEGENFISDSVNYPEGAVSYKEEKDAEDAEETEGIEEIEAVEEVKSEKVKSPSGSIFVNNNLTFNGKGTLNVKGNFNEGIYSNENLKIISGIFNVISEGKAVTAQESISIKEPELYLEAGDAGINVFMETDPDKGFIVIDGGKILIKAGDDGIHAETHLTINDGYIDVIECLEGLEAQMIDISGGEVYVNSTDDGINATTIIHHDDDFPPIPATIDENGNVVLLFGFGANMGNNKMPPTDDGEYETDFLGEDLEETTEDVAFDFGPQKDYKNDKQIYVRITGGKVHVKVEGSDVDGIDSNGSIYIGGDAEVYVDQASGNLFGNLASMDASGSNIISNNATLLITATDKMPSFEDMEPLKFKEYTVEEVLEIHPEFTEDQANQYIELTKNFFPPPLPEDGELPPLMNEELEKATCIQPYVKIKFNELKENGTSIIVKDKEGEILINHKPRAGFKSILFTSPKIKEGETYTIIASNETVTAVAQVDEEEEIPNEN